MHVRYWCTAIALLAGIGASAVAQPDLNTPPKSAPYKPRLVDIMSAIQLQHLKLWYAGKSKNWDLAAYELRHLTDSLTAAADFYPGIPVDNVATLGTPLQATSSAVAEKDGRKFAAAMRQLTDGCNGCHISMDRAVVVMTLPTGQAAPPANQVFAPAARDEK